MVFFFLDSVFLYFFQEGFDQAFIEEAIIGRLKDDNRDVVMSALSSLEVNVCLLACEILPGLECVCVSGMYSV